MQTNKKIFFNAANRWAAFTLLAGLLVSIAASMGAAHFNRSQASQAATAAAEATADAVENRLKLYQYGLRGARGAIQALGEDALGRESFDRYSRTRSVDVEFPGARGFGFIRRVPPRDEAQFLAEARADGWPDFTIRELGPNDSERFVIQYISEIERNRPAIGLDIASEANRRAAAISAMRSGEVRLTGPITLVQATGAPQQSFLILMPIYRDGVTPDTVAAREAQTVGWSYAPLITDEVLRGIRPEAQAVSLELRDITDPDQNIVFYMSEKESVQEVLLSHTVERTVYGRRWQLQFEVYPPFVSQLRQISPFLVLGAGILLSALLASLVGVLRLSRSQQAQVVAEQKKLAAIVESSADGIIGKDLNGAVTSWNNGAHVLLGFSAEEAIGRRVVDLMVPADRLAEESSIQTSIQKGTPVASFRTLRKHKNQQLIPVSITVSPILDSSANVVGASLSVRDISKQVEAEAKINELNSNLESQVVERTTELRQLNALLDNVLRSASEVAIIATDRDGVIRLFNTGAERMLGYSAGELIGNSSPAIFHLTEEVAARSDELTGQYGKPIEGFRVFVHKAELDGAETREWIYTRKDGSRLPVSLAVTSIRDEAGDCNGYLGIAVDLTARKTSENAVATARDQLLMAAEVAELGIWSWAVAEGTLTWNDRMFEMYGQPLNLRDTGLNYTHWHSRVHPDDVEMAEGVLHQAVTHGTVYAPIFRVVRPDGSERVVQAGARVERDAKGVAVRVTGINRDITEQLELEARLRDAKEQADASSAAKSNFLANMSHEIRTPMNAVLGMLHLVQNTELDTRQQDYISNAESAAKSLLGLLNDVLDYSKIEAGKLLLDAHAFELEPLLRDLAVVLSGNQGDKKVEIVFDLDPLLPNNLIGDSQRLQQVLINLAGNALKFTSQGHVVVRFKQLQRRGAEVRVRIEVLDTGIGITPDQLSRIFEGFTQAEASTTRRFGGTGLGLVISKRLINLMGGELQVSSEAGLGSRFWFELDLEFTETLPTPTWSPITARPTRLLVADDNEVAGFLLVRIAEAFGWQADLVHDGLQAVRRVQEMRSAGTDYDVILMDWLMPVMDGLSAARLIRRDATGPYVPLIIMITAYGREVLSDAREEGEVPFAGLLNKPITPRQLLELIQKLSTGEPNPQPSVARMRAAQPKRLAGLRLLVVEDNVLNRQVAFELLEGEGARVTLAEGGIDGVHQATNSSEAFDVVLMDIQMPDIDGLEATRRIRSNTERGAVTIIAMTANASNSDVQACIAAGMNDHLGKPIDLEKMVATILRNAGRNEAVPTEQLQTGHGSVVETADAISQRFGGNRQLICNVLSSFAVEQGKQLVRLQEQVDQRNPAGAAAVLHAMKGSSATMGALALSHLAGDLEQRLLHDDDAMKRQLLADESTIETLRSLLARSDKLLRAAFELPSSAAQPDVERSDVLPREEWREAVYDIMRLLEAGNMQAMELSEALQNRTPLELRESFDIFVGLVTSLDFSAALTTGQKLLNSV